jgi:hypothetical protein
MLRSLKDDFELESEETADEIQKDFDLLLPILKGNSRR